MPRQTKYIKNNWEDKLILIQGWARDGLTDKQVASNMGISIRTLYEYKEKYPQFLQALKKGKEVVDYEVESALLRNALNGNTVAQIFWLKNRKPDKWRDKPKESDEKGIPLTKLQKELKDARQRVEGDK